MKPSPKPLKFCKNGHEIALIGRNAFGHCRACKRTNQNRFRKKNIAYYQKHMRKYQDENKEKLSKYWKTYDLNRQEIKRKYNTEYSKTHREEINAQINRKLQINVEFKISTNLRKRMSRAIKDNYKAGSAVTDLGCSIEFFKQYIQDKFYGDMTWKNWGSIWQLDHIKPLASFDLTDRIQLLKAVHYTNLQPLTIEDHKNKTATQKNKRRFKCQIVH